MDVPGSGVSGVGGDGVRGQYESLPWVLHEGDSAGDSAVRCVGSMGHEENVP